MRKLLETNAVRSKKVHKIVANFKFRILSCETTAINRQYNENDCRFVETINLEHLASNATALADNYHVLFGF